MKKALFLLVFLSSIAAIGQPVRYLQPVFPSSIKTAEVVYGRAPAITDPYISEAVTYAMDLKMDVFQPYGDLQARRPVILFAHSGGFLNGSRQHQDMQALCDSFARRGYVTASIDYRVNFNVLSSGSGERAGYRGIQDASAAIRYLKEFRNVYGIDTSAIYLWGSSAGAFIGLQLAYLDNSERPASTFSGFMRPDLGCVNCAGNTYRHSGRIQGVIGCWGAIGDPNWINKSNNNVPAILFHGNQDGTVPYNSGYPWGFVVTMPYVYGSNPINTRLNNQSIQHEFYTGWGKGHEYWGTSNGTFNPVPTPDYQDIIQKASQFLYLQLSPDACIAPPGIYVSNLKSASALLQWSSMKNALSYTLQYRKQGTSKWTSLNLSPASASLQLTKLSASTTYEWQVRQQCSSSPATYSAYSTLRTFTTPASGTREVAAEPVAASTAIDFSLFPNPTTGQVQVKLGQINGPVTVKVLNELGQELLSRTYQPEAASSTVSLDASAWARGVYFVVCQEHEKVSVQKLVKE